MGKMVRPITIARIQAGACFIDCYYIIVVTMLSYMVDEKRHCC